MIEEETGGEEYVNGVHKGNISDETDRRKYRKLPEVERSTEDSFREKVGEARKMKQKDLILEKVAKPAA